MPIESPNRQQENFRDKETESPVMTKKETPAGISVDEETVLVNQMTEVAANGIVKNHVIASLALGLIPIPLLDISALTATQMNMLRSLSGLYNVSFDDADSKSLITSLLGGALPVLGVIGLSSVAKLIPGIGSLAGSASLSVTAGAVTYAVGQVFIMHFGEGGTMDNFNPKQVQTYFKREFETGKSFVRDIKNEMKAAKVTGEADLADKKKPVS